MTVSQEGAVDGAVRRARIEAMLANYPDVSADQLSELRHWFDREASAFDVAMVASNESINHGYRQFKAEHIDRFTMKEIVRALLIVAATVGLVALIGYWSA